MIQLALEGQHREQRLQSMAQPVLSQLPSWERAAQDPVLLLALWDVLRCWGLQRSPILSRRARAPLGTSCWS